MSIFCSTASHVRLPRRLLPAKAKVICLKPWPRVHWTTAVSADFGTAADWSGAAVPGPTDDAILDAAGSHYTVTASTSQSVNGIQTTAAATLVIDSTFDAAAGTGLRQRRDDHLDGTLTAGGTLDNTGSIAIDNGLLTVAASGLRLSGGGSVTLANLTSNAIVGFSDNAVLTNAATQSSEPALFNNLP